MAAPVMGGMYPKALLFIPAAVGMLLTILLPIAAPAIDEADNGLLPMPPIGVRLPDNAGEGAVAIAPPPESRGKALMPLIIEAADDEETSEREPVKPELSAALDVGIGMVGLGIAGVSNKASLGLGMRCMVEALPPSAAMPWAKTAGA